MAIDYKSIGLRIKNERMRAGLTQEQLATKTGISRQAISYIELGQKGMSLDSVLAICNSLEVSSDEILMDNLIHPSAGNDTDLSYLTLDCSKAELQIITATVGALKDALRQHKIK